MELQYNEISTDSTKIQLILSLVALPINFNQQAARHFAWLILKSEPDGMNDEVREYGMALLWFALRLKPQVPDDDLVALAQWVAQCADDLNPYLSIAEFSGIKQMVINCQKRSAWELFGVKLAELDLKDRSPDLQTWVQLIAEQLVD